MDILRQVEDIFKPASGDEVASRRQEMANKEAEDQERIRQERLRREREQKDREVRLRKVFVSVLRKLGFTKNVDVNDWGASVSAKNTTGGGLYLRLDGNRVLVSGEYPSSPTNHRYMNVYDEQGHEVVAPRITVSPDKSDDQMIIDIQRRFMPSYEKRLGMVKAQVNQETNHNTLTAKNMRILKGKQLSDYEIGNKKMYLGDIVNDATGDITVRGDDVSMDLRDLTVQQAQQIIRIVRGK